MKSTKQTENLAENGNKSKPMLCSGFLAPYFPYSVKIEHPTFMNGKRKVSELYSIKGNHIEISHRMYVEISQCKLILKPISDLSILVKEEFEKYDGLRSGKANEEIINLFCEENGVDELIENIDLKSLPYECIAFMFRNHYDFFGLIEKGLAISIHDVE